MEEFLWEAVSRDISGDSQATHGRARELDRG